ncbi:MAG TPA: methyltransferase domain-containing protein [Thermoplasmata archaeon]|nr:methyltransferase domain-containing protein [Thermoplasmata archaeon]
MRSRSLTVPRDRGEAVRQALAEAGALRADLKIRTGDGTIVFPIAADGSVVPSWGVLGESEFDPRTAESPSDYRELLAWPDAEKGLLPRSFDVVGDVVLVRLPPELRHRGHEIGEALLGFVPRARIVGADRGVHGTERRRSIERLAGDGGWATVHRENHLELEVDLERAYFSPRLALEHTRVAAEVRAGDRVYDLCCGVGPFSVHLARDGRAREIVAVDSNPSAIELLRRTLARYSFGGRVTAVEARIETFLADRAPFERAILNLPHEGIKYASSVAGVVAPGGRLYYYEIVPRAELKQRGDVIAGSLGPTGEWRPIAFHVVHPYAPDADLAGFVFARRGE